jgi:hypothetical protein
MSWQVIQIEVKIYSDWRSGTGKGEGARLDAVTLRDELGLPMLSGRHIKGLFKHAFLSMYEWEKCTKDEIDLLFGYGPLNDEESAKISRFESTSGTLNFSSATLSEEWKSYFKSIEPSERVALLSHFFRSIKQTSIEDEMAKPGSLRTMEVAIPLSLHAQISGDFTAQQFELIKKASKLIRSVGSNRTKGLGRAELILTTQDQKG